MIDFRMKVVKECILQQLGPDQLVSAINRKRKGKKYKIDNVFRDLVDVCGQEDEEIDPVFLEYLWALMKHRSVYIHKVAQYARVEAIFSTLRVIQLKSFDYFNEFPYDEESTDRYALNVLDNLLQCPDEELGENVLNIIMYYPSFAVAIASSWSLIPKEMKIIAPQLENFMDSIKFNKNASYGHSLFETAFHKKILEDPFVDFFPLQSYYILYYFFKNRNIILTFEKNPDAFTNLFLQIYRKYINNSSITMSYILYIYINKMFSSPNKEKSLSEYIIGEIIDNISKESKYTNIQPFPITRDLLDNLMSEPDTTPLEFIPLWMKTIGKPNYCGLLLEEIERITEKASDENMTLINFALKQGEDIQVILLISGLFPKVVENLMNVILSTDKWDVVEPYMELQISILRKCWVTGGEASEYCKKFINNIKDPIVQYFYAHVLPGCYHELGIKNPLKNDHTSGEELPIQHISTTFFSLMLNKVSLKEIGEEISKNGFLWLPAIVWANATHTTQIASILSLKFNKTLLFLDFFNSMNYKMVGNKALLQNFSLFPEINHTLEELPPFINLLSPIIIEQILDLGSYSPSLDHQKLAGIILGWRTWIRICTFHEFFLLLVSILKHQSMAHGDHEIIIIAYRVAALLLSMASDSGDFDIFSELSDYLDSGHFNNLSHAGCLAMFTVILFSTRSEDNRVNGIPRMIALCKEILIEEKDNISAKKTFALKFVQLVSQSLYLPIEVDRSFVPIFVANNNWSAAVQILLQHSLPRHKNK